MPITYRSHIDPVLAVADTAAARTALVEWIRSSFQVVAIDTEVRCHTVGQQYTLRIVVAVAERTVAVAGTS